MASSDGIDIPAQFMERGVPSVLNGGLGFGEGQFEDWGNLSDMPPMIRCVTWI